MNRKTGPSLLCLLILLAIRATPVAAMPNPYLALFTFNGGTSVDKLGEQQLRVLQASPYDGMAIQLLGAYDSDAPPVMAELSRRVVQWRTITTKDLWPFVFLNRVIQQDNGSNAHVSASMDKAFTTIKGMDLDNESGALDGLLLNWRRALQLAKELKSPGIGLDMEFYNNYPLAEVSALAVRRGEAIEETRRKLRLLGSLMADILEQEYPTAVIWSLISRLQVKPVIGAQPRIPYSCGYISEGLLARAKAKKIPLTLIDGAEDTIGYQHRSLDDLKKKLQIQENDIMVWTANYPFLLLGATIAPWLDLDHRAYWMKEKPAVEKIENFKPFFILLLRKRPFVWIYGAGSAYNAWEEPYVTRFARTLEEARAEALRE